MTLVALVSSALGVYPRGGKGVGEMAQRLKKSKKGRKKRRRKEERRERRKEGKNKGSKKGKTSTHSSEVFIPFIIVVS